MKMKIVAPYFFALLLVAAATAPAWGANGVSVLPAAALEGSYGLAVDVDGSTNRVYVQDNSPANETIFRAEFLFRRGTLTMVPPNNHVVFLGQQETLTPPAQPVIRLTIVRVADGRYFLRAFAYQNTGAYRFIGGTGLGTNPNAIWKIGVEWKASDPGMNNGELRLYKNDGLQQQRTDLINEGLVVDQVRLGAIAFMDASSSGQYHMDSYASFRTFVP